MIKKSALAALPCGVRCPILISLGYSPVSAVLFSRSAICSCMTSGAYLKCLVLRESHPALLLLFSDFIARCTSSFVNSFCTFDDFISGHFIALSFWKSAFKMFGNFSDFRFYKSVWANKSSFDFYKSIYTFLMQNVISFLLL